MPVDGTGNLLFPPDWKHELISTARSHVPLRGAWAEGHCYDWVVPQKVHVRRMMLGPDADDLTIIEDSSGGIWDLYVLDKYTGQRTFAIEALPDEVNVVAGGGYLVTSSNGNSEHSIAAYLTQAPMQVSRYFSRWGSLPSGESPKRSLISITTSSTMLPTDLQL